MRSRHAATSMPNARFVSKNAADSMQERRFRLHGCWGGRSASPTVFGRDQAIKDQKQNKVAFIFMAAVRWKDEKIDKLTNAIDWAQKDKMNRIGARKETARITMVALIAPISIYGLDGSFHGSFDGWNTMSFFFPLWSALRIIISRSTLHVLGNILLFGMVLQHVVSSSFRLMRKRSWSEVGGAPSLWQGALSMFGTSNFPRQAAKQ